MEYDRARVKETAKAALRQARPRPWLVTLVHGLLTQAIPGVIMMIVFWPMIIYSAASSDSSVYRDGFASGEPIMIPLMLFLYVLTMLFIVVMQVGYQYYCMKLWRGERTDFKDIFRGFSMVPRTLALFGLSFLFTLLWSLPALVVMSLFSGILFTHSSSFTLMLLPLLLQIGLSAYLCNRTLRYALSFFLLLDHPEYTALQALNESKRLMVGRRWSLFVLLLSFLGWGLLILLIIYAVIFVGFLIVGIAVIVSMESAGSYLGVVAAVLLMFVLIFGSILASAPLSLWLQAYMGTATAGFYDFAAGYMREASPLPEPSPLDPGPVGSFYSGFPPKGATPPEDQGPAGSFYSGFAAPKPPEPAPPLPAPEPPEAVPPEDTAPPDDTAP